MYHKLSSLTTHWARSIKSTQNVKMRHKKLVASVLNKSGPCTKTLSHSVSKSIQNVNNLSKISFSFFRSPSYRFFSTQTSNSQIMSQIESMLEEANIYTEKLQTLNPKSDSLLYQEYQEKQLSIFLKSFEFSAAKLGLQNGLVCSILITLIRHYDSMERFDDLVKFIESHDSILKQENVVSCEILGFFCESLHSIGRLADSIEYSEKYCQLLMHLYYAQMTIDDIHRQFGTYVDHLRLLVNADKVAIGLFNLAIMYHSAGLEEQSISKYIEASDLIENLENLKNPDDVVAADVSAAIHTNLSSALIRSGKPKDAIQYLVKALDARQLLIKADRNNQQLREEFIMTSEALANLYTELGILDAAKNCWERASIVLEYEGDPSVLPFPDLVLPTTELQLASSNPAEVASIHHGHAKALLACNTPESLSNSVAPLKKAIDIYRELKDNVALLDALEDLSNVYEFIATGGGAEEAKSDAYADDQLAVFGECLVVSEALYGPTHLENGRYLNNMAILLASKGDETQAKDLVLAAAYICEKNQATKSDIYSTSQTLMLMMGLTDSLNEMRKDGKTVLPNSTKPLKQLSKNASAAQKKRWKQQQQTKL